MESDDFSEEEELGALVRLYAARRAQAIINREGAALIQSARAMDEGSVKTNSQFLAIAITRAITAAYSGNIDGGVADEPESH